MVWFRRAILVVLALIAVSLLLMGLVAASSNMPCRAEAEAFVPVVPDTRIQTAPSVSGPQDPVELNGCWRTILTYLQTNPSKAMPFLNFLKANFFNSSCELRQPRIQFETLADHYQPIFT